MAVVIIEKIATRTKKSKAGKDYKVVEVIGKKFGTDEEWNTNIFKNKTELLEQLEEFGPGETASFRFKKDGQFYNLVSITEPTQEDLDYAATQATEPKKAPWKKSGGSEGSSAGKSSAMSKGEWAEKDRLTNIRISKAVAIKLACDNTKVGTSMDALVEMAEELVPWLLDTDINHMGKEPEDALSPLDPPVED